MLCNLKGYIPKQNSHKESKVSEIRSVEQRKKEFLDAFDKLKRRSAMDWRNPAYRDWIYKLRKNEKLPRGKFFKNKVAGQPTPVTGELEYLCE